MKRTAILAGVVLSAVGTFAIGVVSASAFGPQVTRVLSGNTLPIPAGHTCGYTNYGLVGTDLRGAIAFADIQGQPGGQFVQNVTIQSPFAKTFPNYVRVCLNEPASGGPNPSGVHVSWVVIGP